MIRDEQMELIPRQLAEEKEKSMALQKEVAEKERISNEQNRLVEQTHRNAALSECQAQTFAMQLTGAERRIGELDARELWLPNKLDTS